MTRSASYIIGVAGGSGSGKSTFARALQLRLGEDVCSVLSQDHYYIDQSHRFTGDGESVNFDHPSALDFPLLVSQLKALRTGGSVEVPNYDFPTHKRLAQTTRFTGTPVIVVDGILILSQPEVRACFDESVFIETPEELRFQRRLHRDIRERGRQEEGVRKQFLRQVKPMHDQFVEPSKAFATRTVSGMAPFDPHLMEWAMELTRRL